ncbi:MAG: hypothetical protein BWY85_01584 [Firmicutes bacterium ADurb.Bin506]|nr:MAG: hypothetical protein BWY85_01584 [Firmicutes bacterium ADurb.Bin506]
MAGLHSGSTTWVSTLKREQPSMIAASSSDLGMLNKNCLMRNAPNGPAMNGRMSAL